MYSKNNIFDEKQIKMRKTASALYITDLSCSAQLSVLYVGSIFFVD